MKQQHMSVCKRICKSLCIGILITLSLVASSGCAGNSSTGTKGSVGGNANFPFALPPSTPLICPNDESHGQGLLVASDGKQLIYQGKPLKLYGYAFYPAQIGGASAWHTPGFTHYIDLTLDLGAQGGQNLVRPTDFWASNYRDQKQDDVTIWK